VVGKLGVMCAAHASLRARLFASVECARRCDDDDSDIEIMANFVHARTQPVEAYEVKSTIGSLKRCQRFPLLEGEAIL
jgi:hypothetical protein